MASSVFKACIIVLTGILFSCEMERLRNDPKKEVRLIGKADPVIRGSWRKMGDFFNENAVYQLLFVVKGKAYFRVTMVEQDLESDFWVYDPVANSFSAKKELPTKDGGHLFMAIGDRGYYGPGLTFFEGDYTNTNEFWQYNPDNDNWTRKSDFIVNDIRFPGVFVIGSSAYICGWGAKDGYRSAPDVYQYNSVTDTWSAKNVRYPLNRYWSTTLQFNINGLGYVFGGGFGNIPNNDRDIDSLFLAKYSPIDNSFTKLSHATFPLTYSPQTSWVIDNNIYFYCGGKDWNFSPNTNDIWEFNSSNSSWKRLKDFDGPLRHGSFGFSVGNKAYICFGDNTGLIQYDDIWEYNP
jgi:hypothetical protein